MIDQIRRLARGSIIYGVGNALNQFLNVLLLPLFTSYLSPSDYGVTSVLNIFILIVFNIFSLGLGTSIGLSYFDNDASIKQKNQTIYNSFLVLSISSIVACAFGFIFSNNINLFLFHSNKYSYLVWLTIISSFFTTTIMPFSLRLQFEEKQVRFVILTIISSLFTIGINVLLIVYLKKGLQGRVEATLISAVFAFSLYLIASIKSIKISFNFTICKNLIKYGLPMIPSFLALYVLQQGNVYFITKYKSLNEVGLYSIGSSFANAIMLVIGAFTVAFYPFGMSFINKQDEAKSLFGKIFTYYIFIGGLISLLFYIFAKPVVMLLTHPAFFESYKVIGLISTAFYLLPLFNIALMPLYYRKDVKYVLVFQIISALFYALFAIIIIPKSGIIGAALAFIFGYLIMDIFTVLWSYINKKKYLQINYEFKRIFIFLSIYVVDVIFILIEKKLNQFVEHFMYFLMFVITIIITYKLLSKSEHFAIIDFFKNYNKIFTKEKSV